ncbi:hypothetical protein BABINDRAFT_8396 [Babjeviella inositovora NRRL Y-12698]|uniref:Enoyl reductase (ER) domain-containing protein n=1 Tax=Babjeviella inositovora NRRL Y-12698 TaxID=984486 RepID=A0A1E3QP29_9ASCO|nr:uncharacterized protein BABINDRAFT_8396 [Babjeviella inositovora NRRL Y-12698]ODQ79466.1 hypothetical protein BABINDRAFT_8396 [Babjeviella inositovora NRRL Y-12698]
MKGLLYYGNRDMRYSNNVPEPELIDARDVKIEVEWCGICGSDLHEYLDGPIFFPHDPNGKNHVSDFGYHLCLGHEYSGTVTEIGSKVSTLKVGDTVVVETTGGCNDRYRYPNAPNFGTKKCTACRNGKTNACKYLTFQGLGLSSGALAERVVVGEHHVVKIDNSKIPFDIGALIEPLAVAWHAVSHSGFKKGSNALVLGAGPIGLAVVLALQGHGAGTIVCSEPADIRRDQAGTLGAQTFNPMDSKDSIEDLRAMAPGGEGFEHTFDASGVPSTFTSSIQCLGPHGVAVNIAIWGHKPVDIYPMDITLQEKNVTGVMCYTRKDFEETISAIENGLIDIEKIRKMITGKVRLEDSVEKGILELVNNKEKNVKILVSPKMGNV